MIISRKNTALLLIDFQRDFCEKDGYAYKFSGNINWVKPILPKAKKLLDFARKNKLFIIHTREGYKRDLSDCDKFRLERSKTAGAQIGSKGPMGRLLICGEHGQDIIDLLKPIKGEKVLDKSSGLEPMGRPKNLKLEHFNMSSTFPAFSVRGVDGTIKVEDYFGKSFIVEDIKVEFYGPKPGSDGSRPEIPECEADLIVTRGTPDCLFMGYMLKGSGVYIARWGMDPIPELDYTESFPMRCYPTLYRDHGFTFLTLDDHNTPIWDELYGRVSYGGGDITLKRMLKLLQFS